MTKSSFLLQGMLQALIFIVIIFTFFPQNAFASYLEVSLFFDGQELREDREVPDPVKKQEGRSFNRQNISEDVTDYQLVISNDSRRLYSHYIELPDQDEGPVTIEVPNLGLADTLEIYTKNERSAKFNIDNFKTCFPNNICEYEKGETKLTCPSDCDAQIRSEPVDFSPETQRTLQEQNGVIRDQEGTVLIDGRESSEEPSDPAPQEDDGPSIVLLIAGIGLIVGAGGLWIFFQMKK